MNPGKTFVWMITGLAMVAAPLTARAQSETERLEKLERAVELLQKRNAELENEVRDLKGKTATRASVHENAPAKSESESKAVAEKTVEKKPVYAVAAAEEFKLTLGGYVQSQFEGGDPFAFEGRFASAQLKDRFRVRRARITIAGDYTEHFDFKVEGDFSFSDTALTIRDANGRTLGSNSTRTSFSATDVFINWHTYPELNIKAGQYKAPFGLEQLTPDPTVISIERSLITDSVTPERQIGVQVWGKPFTNLWPQEKDLLTYYAGVFNGTGRNISVNDNNEFMYAGRLEVQALKTKILNEDASLRFGVNGVYSRDDAGTTVSNVIRENSDGSLAAYNLPSAGERREYGFDAALHIGPFDLIAEYLDDRISPRRVNNINPLFTTFEPNGYYVQGSYFLLPKKLQLVVKWESFDPDQFADDDLHSITGGVNYFIHGNNVRLAANYIHTWSDFRDSRSLARSDFDEVIVRLQLVF